MRRDPARAVLQHWRAALALALGALSGAFANAIGLPLPWMLGPMIGITIAAMAGAPVRGPARLRPVVLPVIGVMLGSGMHADLLDAFARWTATFALLVPFLVTAAASSYVFYRRIGRYDPVTAYFSAMPGGLNDMLILGAAAGGEEKRIALAHASRILIVVLFVALFFGLVMGVSTGGSAARGAALGDLTARDWLFLAACAVFGVKLGTWARLPAATILGPMILSGAAHVTGLVTVAPPAIIIIAAQVVIGTVIGGRFLGATAREVARDIALGVVSSLIMIAVAILFALLVSRITGTHLAQAFLAYSPGGLTEMSLLALAMGQEVAYVSVMHIARITLVIFAAAPVFRMLRR